MRLFSIHWPKLDLKALLPKTMRAIYHHSFRAINLSESAKFGAKHMNTLVLDCDICRYLSACSLWGTRPRGQKTLLRNCSRTIVRKEGVGEMEVWKNLQMGSPASILLSRRKESMGFLRNKCFASLFVLHISLICITGGLGGLSLSLSLPLPLSYLHHIFISPYLPQTCERQILIGQIYFSAAP